MAKLLCKRLAGHRAWGSSYEVIHDLLDNGATRLNALPRFDGFGTELGKNKRIFSDVSQLSDDFKAVFRFKNTKVANWIVERKVQAFCDDYSTLSKEDRHLVLWDITQQFTVNESSINEQAKKLLCESNNRCQLMLRQNKLKFSLCPPYHRLFTVIGRLEFGVKFLVELRADVLDLLEQLEDPEKTITLQQLNDTLDNLLYVWFSPGFLCLERVTWQTSCQMLEKISDYEAIRPIRNWLDLKRRVGPYRRCFVFTHPSMPGEPLVILHTALCDLVPESVKGIEEAEKRILSRTEAPGIVENEQTIRAAVFYSVASTQRGLKGIDLGKYMIKRVAEEVTREFPAIDHLATLSPIPKFREWFLDRVKQDPGTMFTEEEREAAERVLQTRDLRTALKKLFNNSLWLNDKETTDVLKTPLTRACAWYLYKEKRRNYALNSVANFHLRNGAIMWRINWMADTSPREAENSCGIMINYRYILSETEENNYRYVKDHEIKASESVIELANQAEMLRSC